MVLVGTPGVTPAGVANPDPFDMTAGEAKAAIFYDPAQVPDDYARGSRGAYRTVARDWKLSDCMTMPDRHNPGLPRSLGCLHLPTLLVWGEHDAMVPVGIGQLYRQAIPGARLTVIKRCGHAVYMERPDAFLSEVLVFLGATPPRPRPRRRRQWRLRPPVGGIPGQAGRRPPLKNEAGSPLAPRCPALAGESRGLRNPRRCRAEWRAAKPPPTLQ